MSAKTRRQQLEEMLAAEPGDVELRYMLGMEHVSAGDDEGAVRCFEELLRLDPAYPPAYHQAARALVRLDRPAAARALLQRGIPAARQKGDDHAAGEMQGLLESLD
jgi:cytochrome c-type biogenesis protein CcmH/NrfG